MWHSFQSMFTVRLVSSTLSFPGPFRQKSIATTLVLFASRPGRLSLSDERRFKRKWPSTVVQIGHQRTNLLGSVNRRKQDRRQRFQSLWFIHVAWHTRRMATKAATVLLLPLTRNDLLTEGRSHAPGRPAKKWLFSALFRYLWSYARNFKNGNESLRISFFIFRQKAPTLRVSFFKNQVVFTELIFSQGNCFEKLEIFRNFIKLA